MISLGFELKKSFLKIEGFFFLLLLKLSKKKGLEFMDNIPIPANYHDILLKPEHNILIMGDKVGEFAGGLVNLRYQQMVPDEDNTPMDECWRAWEKALSSIYVLVPTRPDWLGTLTMLDLDRVRDKDFIKKHVLELDLIGDVSTDDLNKLANKIRRRTGVDKFDFIIGNPPYQKDTKGNNMSYTPIYPYFMELSYLLSNKTVLITPARFLFNAGNTKTKWNQKMLDDKHLKVLKFFPDSRVVFSNANVVGGVVVTLRDTSQDFGAIKAFITNPVLKRIKDKVWTQTKNNIIPIMFLQNKFDLDALFEKYPNAKKDIKTKEKRLKSNIFSKRNIPFKEYQKNDNYVKILGLEDYQRTYKYINRYLITDNGNLNNYKVILPQSYGSGNLGWTNIVTLIGKPEIGVPNEGYTQTFISFGRFKTKKEAQNCLKYLKSKFARTMLGILKVTTNNPINKWKFVPMQDFSNNSDINWNVDRLMLDQQFYNKYNLTLHESTWIEDHIKEMD